MKDQRILPYNAIEFLDDLEKRAREAAETADTIAWGCFTGVSLDTIKAQRRAFLDLKKKIDMDIDGMRLYLSRIQDNLILINDLNSHVVALYSDFNGDRDFADEEVGRYGLDADSFFPQKEE